MFGQVAQTLNDTRNTPPNSLKPLVRNRYMSSIPILGKNFTQLVRDVGHPFRSFTLPPRARHIANEWIESKN